MHLITKHFLLAALSYSVVGSNAQFGGLFGKTKAADIPHGSADLAHSTDQKDTNAAVKFLQDKFEATISTPKAQQIIAAIVFAAGAVALYDGHFFFKKIVVLGFMASALCVALVLLDGLLPPFVKYVTAVQISLVAGWATFMGWKGAEVILGLVGGMWATKGLDVFASLLLSFFLSYVKGAPPDFDLYQSNAYLIVSRTFGIGLGLFAVHERGGGKRFFGFLAPILGSSLVVAACGYCAMFLLSKSLQLQKDFRLILETANVPPVWEFWLMIAQPYSAKPVGVFEYAGLDFTLHSQRVQFDRIAALFFWIVISYSSIKFQWSELRKTKMSTESTLAKSSGGYKTSPKR